MRTLYIHIGVGRTGSSALQVQLARNADYLRSCGINYMETEWVERARLGEITSGNGLPFYCVFNPESVGVHGWEPALTAHVVKSCFGACETALVSSEILGYLEPAKWTRMKSFCRDIDIRFVVFVRNALGSFVSAYARHQATGDFSGTFSEYLRSGAMYDAAVIMRTIVDCFGVDSCAVLHYETHRDRIFEAFCNVLGIRAPPHEDVFVNVSSDPPEVSAEDRALAREMFSRDVAWLNDTFFPGRAVVSV